VTPFRIILRPGLPISDQIVFAAKRAIVAGEMRPGDAFPSVRALSKDLRINPNTAHRAVTELINAGLLAMHPGIGTVVATPPDGTLQQRSELLNSQIEALAVDARQLGIQKQELIDSLSRHYDLLTPPSGGSTGK